LDINEESDVMQFIKKNGIFFLLAICLVACNFPFQEKLAPVILINTPIPTSLQEEEYQLECGDVQCEDHLDVKLRGNVPNDYVMALETVQGEIIRVHCANGVNVEGSGRVDEPVCAEWGVSFPFIAADVTVKMWWDNYQLSHTIKPKYQRLQPNGEGCEPVCWTGELEIRIPKNP
jgi:hypothetical protein